jgi:CBS domain-containing protein
MLTLTKPFLALTAADLMTTDLVVIPRAMSLQGAAHLLLQSKITGAPVVDAEGRCIGVLSATDFLAWTDKGEHAAKRSPPSCATAHSAWQLMDVERLPASEVSRYMTADPVTVTPATPIGELAQKMLDGHIHRVIVVNELEHPVGIVSSTDVLAAVAYADRKRRAGKPW